MSEKDRQELDYRPDSSTVWPDSAWARVNAQMREMADLGVHTECFQSDRGQIAATSEAANGRTMRKG
jgi:hypothetical protein